MSGRCILIGPDRIRRCRRRAAKRMGDLYACCGHDLLALALLDECSFPETRRLLAHSRWETKDEVLRLLRRTRGRKAAA